MCMFKPWEGVHVHGRIYWNPDFSSAITVDGFDAVRSRDFQDAQIS